MTDEVKETAQVAAPNPSNVIAFPVTKKPIPKTEMPNIEEIKTNIKALKEEDIVDMTETLGSVIFETLTASGFKVDTTPEKLPHFCFFIESLKSLISDRFNVEHPFHELARKCFVPNEEGDIVFYEPKMKFPEVPSIPIEMYDETEEASKEDVP